MSIVPLTVYLLAVYGLSNLYSANGKPFSGSYKSKNDGRVQSDAPVEQFQPLDADWLSRLQGEDFQEVDSDSGRGGVSPSGFDTSVESTTGSSLGFDFNYLFDKDTDSNKPSDDSNWVKPQAADNQHQNDVEKNPLKNSEIFDQLQQVFGADDQVKNPRHDSETFNQNQQSFGFNNPGFHQGNIQSFDPFSLPFLQVPNFLNAGRRGYSARNRGPLSIFGGRGYSRGLGFVPPPPPPQFFHRGFGAY